MTTAKCWFSHTGTVIRWSYK